MKRTSLTRPALVASLASAVLLAVLPTTAGAQEATPSPSPTPVAPGPPPPFVEANPAAVASGSAADITVSYGGNGDGTVELYAADGGSGDFRLIRTAVTEPDSTTTFRVYPDRHKVFYGRHVPSGSSVGRNGNDVDVTVRAAASIDAVRNGTRDYTFRGAVRPATTGLVVSLYRVGGNGEQVLAAQARTDSAGRYSIRRAFSGSGRYGVFVRAAATGINEAGDSRTRPTLIY